RLVGDQMMEIATKPWDWRVVVVHHREAKTDHQNQRHKVGEVEAAAVLAGSERGFNAVPNHQDGGEGPEQVLSHPVEDPKVLLHQRVDCLQHSVEEVHGISVVLRSGSRSLWHAISTEAVSQDRVETSQILS